MAPAALIIGGSRGLGRAIALHLAEQNYDLIVTARASSALVETVAALRNLTTGTVHELALDVAEVDATAAAAYSARCLQLLPDISQVYLTVGSNDPRDVGTASHTVLPDLMAVNAIGLCHLVACFAENLRERSANLTVVSSVAAVRGRRRNLAYAASKRALETFVAGLRHEVAGGPLRLQVIRAGYIRSRLSEGQSLRVRPADPAKVARSICRGHDRDFGMRYAPRYWRFIAIALRCLPWRLYRRLSV